MQRNSGLNQSPPVRIVEDGAPHDPLDEVAFHYGDTRVEVDARWLEDYARQPSRWPSEEEVLEAYVPEYVQGTREDDELPPWGELVVEALRGCWNLPRTNTDVLFWRGSSWGGGYMVLEHALRLVGVFYEHAWDETSGFDPGRSYHLWLRTLLSRRNRHPTTGQLIAPLCRLDSNYAVADEASAQAQTLLGWASPYISLRGEDDRFADAHLQVVPGSAVCSEDRGFQRKVPSRSWEHPWYVPHRVEVPVYQERNEEDCSERGFPIGVRFYWVPAGSQDGGLDHDMPSSESWDADWVHGWPERLWRDGAWVKGNSGGVIPFVGDHSPRVVKELNLRAGRDSAVTEPRNEDRLSVRRYGSPDLTEAGAKVACVLRKDGGLDKLEVEGDRGKVTEMVPALDPSWCRLLDPGLSLAEEGHPLERLEEVTTSRAEFTMLPCMSKWDDPGPLWREPPVTCEPTAGVDPAPSGFVEQIEKPRPFQAKKKPETLKVRPPGLG